MLLEKLRYLTQDASYVVFAGTLPRNVGDGFYAEATRDLAKRGVASVLDTEGEPLRLGVEAEPFLVSPNQEEAESLVGQEFHDEEDFRIALDGIADMGARNVLITTDEGSLALLREDRETYRYRANAPQVDPVSAVGAGDVLVAGFLAARNAGRSHQDALRAAVGAAAASTLELGAGHFDPRQAGRLQSGVEIDELEPVEA
jgi:fructose-1-phosphate kinase PfkB-like protein